MTLPYNIKFNIIFKFDIIFLCYILFSKHRREMILCISLSFDLLYFLVFIHINWYICTQEIEYYYITVAKFINVCFTHSLAMKEKNAYPCAYLSHLNLIIFLFYSLNGSGYYTN